jgi:hypothetical protein
MDPKQIKLKLSSQLNDNDKQYIREHSDQFSDEDREAWKDALGSAGEAAAVVEPETPAAPAAVEPAAPVTPEPAAQPQTPQGGFTFANEDEAKAYVAKLFDAEKQKAIDAARTPEEKKYVEDTWKPKNWNESIKTTAEAAADILEQRQQLRNKQVEEHNKKVEADWQSLRTEHKLKDIDDAEGLKVHDAIIAIGAKYGKKNFKDAYEAYLTIPAEFGGGYKPKTETPAPADPATPAPAAAAPTVTTSEAAAILAKSKSEAAKKAASKVGGNNPGTNAKPGNAGIKPISYEDLKKSPSKLLREAMQG